MAKKPVKIVRICRYCGAEVENLELNYCPNCRNILWSGSVYKKSNIL